MSATESTASSQTMKNSWLIQRLERPRVSSFLGKDNPFAFGGGLRNGGLSAQAMDLLRPVFSFAYMGAAEYEYGAVPETLQALASDTDHLVTTTIEVKWSKTKKRAAGSGSVYVLCRSSHLDEVTSRITRWAKTEYMDDLRDYLGLHDALVEHAEARALGWLELNNGFLFFADRDMWAATCEIFGVSTDA